MLQLHNTHEMCPQGKRVSNISITTSWWPDEIFFKNTVASANQFPWFSSSKTLICSAHACRCRDGWSIFNLKSKCACTTLNVDTLNWVTTIREDRKKWDRKRDRQMNWSVEWELLPQCFLLNPVCLTHMRSTHACVHLALRLCVCLFCFDSFNTAHNNQAETNSTPLTNSKHFY